MASTATVTRRFVQGNRACRNGTITFGTYAANGIAVTAAQLELTQLFDLDVRPAGGYVAEWDSTAGKVKLYLQDFDLATADAPLVEVGAIDVSATSFKFKCEGV